MTFDTPEYESLAIAYLTGQATQEQVATYRRLYATNDQFKAVVRNIETWLAPLNEDVPDRLAPEGLLESLLEDIEKDAVEAGEASLNTVAVNDNSVKKWKFAAMAASALAVLAIGSHFIPLGSKPAAPSEETQTLMALLSDNTQPELMAIIYEPKTGRVIARLSNVEIPPEKDLQLWLIREGEAAPRSLGVLNPAKTSNQIDFDIPILLQNETDTLAISLENLGGSKSAGPEGPVLYTGAVSALH